MDGFDPMMAINMPEQQGFGLRLWKHLVVQEEK